MLTGRGNLRILPKYKKQQNIVKYLNDKTQKEYLATAECGNNYFTNITGILDIKKLPEPTDFEIDNIIVKIVHKYRDHPSIRSIKFHTGEIIDTFEFQHIFPEDIYEQIKKIRWIKKRKWDIPSKILKESNAYCNQLTDCFNTSICNY